MDDGDNNLREYCSALLTFNSQTLQSLQQHQASLIARGFFWEALVSEELLPITKWALSDDTATLGKGEGDKDRWRAYLVGVGLLLGFVRENWGGPSAFEGNTLDRKKEDKNDNVDDVSAKLARLFGNNDIHDKSLLQVDGESVISAVKYGRFLSGAHKCFVTGSAMNLPFGHWWLLRIYLVWDSVVSIRGPTIVNGIEKAIENHENVTSGVVGMDALL